MQAVALAGALRRLTGAPLDADAKGRLLCGAYRALVCLGNGLAVLTWIRGVHTQRACAWGRSACPCHLSVPVPKP